MSNTMHYTRGTASVLVDSNSYTVTICMYFFVGRSVNITVVLFRPSSLLSVRNTRSPFLANGLGGRMLAACFFAVLFLFLKLRLYFLSNHLVQQFQELVALELFHNVWQQSRGVSTKKISWSNLSCEMQLELNLGRTPQCKDWEFGYPILDGVFPQTKAQSTLPSDHIDLLVLALLSFGT